MSKAKSYIYIIISAVMWGCIGIFVNKLGSFGVSSMELVFIRSLTTVIVLGAVIAIKDRGLFKIQLKDIWIFLGTGIVSFTFFNFCYFSSINLCSMSVAAALLYTAPVFVMIFSAILFKEKLNTAKIIAIVITVAGCFSISGMFTGGEYGIKGIIMGVLSGFGYSLYSIFARYGVGKYSTLTIIFYTFCASAIATLPFISFDAAAAHLADIQTLLWAVMAGVFTCVLPYLFYTSGLRGVPSGTASVIATVEPAVAAVLSAVIYHEVISGFKLAGIIMILSAVVIAALGERKK